MNGHGGLVYNLSTIDAEYSTSGDAHLGALWERYGPTELGLLSVSKNLAAFHTLGHFDGLPCNDEAIDLVADVHVLFLYAWEVERSHDLQEEKGVNEEVWAIFKSKAVLFCRLESP